MWCVIAPQGAEAGNDQHAHPAAAQPAVCAGCRAICVALLGKPRMDFQHSCGALGHQCAHRGIACQSGRKCMAAQMHRWGPPPCCCPVAVTYDNFCCAGAPQQPSTMVRPSQTRSTHRAAALTLSARRCCWICWTHGVLARRWPSRCILPALGGALKQQSGQCVGPG